MLLFMPVLFLLVASATIRVLKKAAVAVFFWLWYLNLERAAEAPLFQHRACDSCWLFIRRLCRSQVQLPRGSSCLLMTYNSGIIELINMPDSSLALWAACLALR